MCDLWICAYSVSWEYHLVRSESAMLSVGKKESLITKLREKNRFKIACVPVCTLWFSFSFQYELLLLLLRVLTLMNERERVYHLLLISSMRLSHNSLELHKKTLLLACLALLFCFHSLFAVFFLVNHPTVFIFDSVYSKRKEDTIKEYEYSRFFVRQYGRFKTYGDGHIKSISSIWCIFAFRFRISLYSVDHPFVARVQRRARAVCALAC